MTASPSAVDVPARSAHPMPTVPLERDAGPGVSAGIVDYLSNRKSEPAWLRRQRRAAILTLPHTPPRLAWAPPELAELQLHQLHCYAAPAHSDPRDFGRDGTPMAKLLRSLDVSDESLRTLGGSQVQVDGEVVHAMLATRWAQTGVVLVDSTRGLTDYGRLFRPWFGTVVARDENVFTQLNAAVFSGGAFIYVPAGVKLSAPIKCIMHQQAPHGGQFGRTLVVLGAGAELTFIESCTSADRAEAMLHCSVGEFLLGPGARLDYVALQNWTPNVFNLSILRARVAAGAAVHWIDCNIGGRLTMKYPCALLEGEGASAEAVSIAVARTGQHHDSGAKMFHRAPRTSSTIAAKSISAGAGRTDYRGWVDLPAAIGPCFNHTRCDALLVDPVSRADTYPAIHVGGIHNTAQHEACISRLSADQIFYIRQRGLSETAARSLSANGFVNDLVERFPLQYSWQIKRLIDLHMDNSVG